MRLTKLGKLALAVALCLVLGLATTASAEQIPGTAPGIYVSYGANNYFFGFVGGAAGGEVEIAPNVFSTFGATVNNIADPAIIWSVNVTNNADAPVDIAVVFGAFASPGFPGPILLHSSVSGGLSHLSGDNNLTSVVPFDAFGFPQGGDFIVNNYTASSLDPFTIQNFWGVEDGFSFVGEPTSQGFQDELFGVGAGGPNDFFFEVVSFTLSNLDAVGMSGTCDFVPVPPSVLLFGSGMLGMGLLGWRRRLG
jgi:hypothetical protein